MAVVDSRFRGRATLCRKIHVVRFSRRTPATQDRNIVGRRVGNEAKEMAVTRNSAVGVTRRSSNNATARLTRRCGIRAVRRRAMSTTLSPPRALATCCMVGFLALGSAPDADAQFTSTNFLDFGLGLDIDANIGYLYDDNVTRAPSGPDKTVRPVLQLEREQDFRLSVDGLQPADARRIRRRRARAQILGAGQYLRRNPGRASVSRLDRVRRPDLCRLCARTRASISGRRCAAAFANAAGASARQPITDSLGVFAAYTHNWRDADNSVFDTHDNSVLASID